VSSTMETSLMWKRGREEGFGTPLNRVAFGLFGSLSSELMPVGISTLAPLGLVNKKVKLKTVNV